MLPFLSCSPFDLSFLFFRRCGTRRFATQTVLALNRENAQEKNISMGSHNRNDSSSTNVQFFNNIKGTGVMASYPVGDRLTTGMSSAEPVQGCTLFGVSTEG